MILSHEPAQTGRDDRAVRARTGQAAAPGGRCCGGPQPVVSLLSGGVAKVTEFLEKNIRQLCSRKWITMTRQRCAAVFSLYMEGGVNGRKQ